MHINMRFPGGKRKALTFSYDDGIRQDKRLVEIFNKYGLKGTFNINSGTMGDERDSDKPNGRMSASEIKTVYAGHEVALHAYTHPFLEKLPVPSALYEVSKDRETLEEVLARPIRGMAYPYGSYNDNVLEVLKLCCICYCRTTPPTHTFEIAQNPLIFRPTCHHSDEKIFELLESFFADNDTYGRCKLCYIWGHSYEFDSGKKFNDWDHAENMAAAASGHEDSVWYATNIEIFDYVTAYNRLIFSMNMRYVTNPNAIPVSFALGSKGESPFTVNPGETISLW